MVFWTWAKGLEDKFDSDNRKNLRHFIVQGNDETIRLKSREVDFDASADGEKGTAQVDPHEVAQGAALYYIAESASEMSTDKMADPDEIVEERRELVRINTCAIFHKLTPGKGVPHSFVGFIRQWPALPRVVVSILLIIYLACPKSHDHRYSFL